MNKETDFRNWLYQTACDYDTLKRDAEYKMELYLKKYIAELQGGANGFISFNDEIGFSNFRDYSNDLWETIFGVRILVTNNEKSGECEYKLFIYTDNYPIEDMDNKEDGTWSDGWFNPKFRGELNMFEILECCREYEDLILNT